MGRRHTLRKEIVNCQNMLGGEKCGRVQFIFRELDRYERYEGGLNYMSINNIAPALDRRILSCLET